MFTKLFWVIFLFCLDLELFAKIKKDLVSTHSLKSFLLITQDLNKMKNIPNTFLQGFLSIKYVKNFSNNYSTLRQLQLVKILIFQPKTWFARNNRALSNQILHYLINQCYQIIKQSARKSQRYNNHASHLKHFIS